MYVFKTKGSTIESVVRNQKHAFKNKPKEWERGEIVLLSKTRNSRKKGEKEIQYIMRIEDIRKAREGEVEKYWPGNEGRWNYIVECFGLIKLSLPFDLADVLGREGAKQFQGVITYKRLHRLDEEKIKDYIRKTNGEVL